MLLILECWIHKANIAAGCYLTLLPVEGMRYLAGFPINQGTFFLNRNVAEPPLDLQKQIFPDVDRYLEEHKNGVFVNIAASRVQQIDCA